MTKREIKKLQRAIALIDKAYDLIGEAKDSLSDREEDALVYKLDDIQLDINNQAYYIKDMCDAN